MASGNALIVFSPQAVAGPATTFAQIDTIAGTSSPAETFMVLAFDTSTIEYADFVGKLPPHYAGGGLTVSLCTAASTTTGGIVWEAAFRAWPDDAEDLDTTAFTYDFNTLTISTLPSAVGEVTYDNITFTSGADMDSLAVGENFVLRIRRKTDNGSDTATGDAFLHGVEIRET